MNLEIERRWLVNLDQVPLNLIVDENTVYIRQFYTKDKVRYRFQKERSNKEPKYIETIKTGEGLVRGEKETVVSQEKFLEEYKKAKTPEMVTKERIKIPFNGVTIELDRFFFQDGLCIAEIEFPDENSANNFTNIPAWFGKEITNEKGQSNYDLFVKINQE